jgi:hypothetical protein
MRYKELERLICAGAINSQFRAQLVRDPRRAAETGFFGQGFALNQDEWELLGAIRAQDFSQLAGQVCQWISYRRHGRSIMDSTLKQLAMAESSQSGIAQLV